MVQIRAVTLKFKDIEELVVDLSKIHRRITYSFPDEHYLWRAEECIYRRPKRDLISSSIGSLKEEFKKIKPLLDSLGKRAYTQLFYYAQSRTYRAGNHEDYYLCTAGIRLRLTGGIFLEECLMRLDEGSTEYIGRNAPRIVDSKGDIILDLIGHLTAGNN